MNIPINIFGNCRSKEKLCYDKDSQLPVLRCSICTGERVAGFKDLATGKFQDVMLIRNDRELQKFCELYGIDKIEKEY